MKRKIIIAICSIVSIVLIAFFTISLLLSSQQNKEVQSIETKKEEELDSKYISDLLKIDETTPKASESSAKDAISRMLWKINNTKEFMVKTSGNANAGLNQDISNERIVKDNKALITTVSSGILKVGNQRLVLEDRCLYRNTAKLDNLTAVFDDSIECNVESIESYKKRYGWLPFQATGYVLNTHTYLEEPTIAKNNDNYVISCDLEPTISSYWYRREVLTTSKSSSIPKFKKVHIDFTIDNDYKLLEAHYNEVYNVTVIFNSTVTTDVVDKFSYDNVMFNQSYMNYFDKYLSKEITK